MIEFLCPNGPRIRCAAEQAGRAAKCPRCGVKFRIPDAADLNVSEAVGSDSNVTGPEFTDSDSGSKKPPPVISRPPREPQIEFLCPNGHRLHGPASLQGKPGECPDCGSRFRIPVYDETSSEEIHLGRAEGQEGPPPAPAEARPVQPPALTPLPPEEAPPAPVIAPAGEIAVQGPAALFTRLWDLRPEGATVEVRLRDGETILPHQFLKRLSQESGQAVFAVKDADGRLAIVAAPWDAVARATLRGLAELPKELAE